MARVSFKKATEFSGGDFAFGFLKLEDGESVTVRLPYVDVEDIEVYMGHTLSKKHNFKNVECLREEGDPKSVCPFCQKGKNESFGGASPKAYFLFVEEGKEEEGFKVWVKGGDVMNSFNSILEEIEGDYDELANVKFKIKRKGEGTSTKYSILLPTKNAIDDTTVDDLLDMMDKDEVPSVRDAGTQLLVKTAEEMEYFIDNGEWEKASLGTKEEDDEDERPLRRRDRKTSAKRKSRDEDLEDDEEDSEEEKPRKTSRKSKSNDEDETTTRKSRGEKAEELDDDDEEEDEIPQRKSRKAKEVEDDNEDDEDLDDVSTRRKRRTTRRASDRI